MTRPLSELRPVEFADTAIHVRNILNVPLVTRGMIVAHYLGKNIPDMTVAFIYLASRHLLDTAVITDEGMQNFARQGRAISSYIDDELSDDHPTDKRFLLRHMELLCLRKGLSRLQSTGFGHDVIFSRTPLAEYYPKFDNSLYVPPLIGHWAIAAKGSARD